MKTIKQPPLNVGKYSIFWSIKTEANNAATVSTESRPEGQSPWTGKIHKIYQSLPYVSPIQDQNDSGQCLLPQLPRAP
jgi:hypothetical protein